MANKVIEHLKKHWAKYALGGTLAGSLLAAKGVSDHIDNKHYVPKEDMVPLGIESNPNFKLGAKKATP